MYLCKDSLETDKNKFNTMTLLFAYIFILSDPKCVYTEFANVYICQQSTIKH